MAPDLTIFLPSLGMGGAERMVVNLLREFDDHGVDVDLVLARAEGTFLDDVPENVSLVDLKAPHLPLYDLLGALPGLTSYLRSTQPPVVLSLMKHGNVVALLAKRFARTDTDVVVSERNHLTSALADEHPTKRAIIRRLVSWLYPGARDVIAISEGVAEDLVSNYSIGRDRITVIYNPVVTPNLHEQAAEPVEHPWFGLNEPPVVLGAGRLNPQKDFPTLIRAFDRVRASRHARLVILGEGDEREDLESLIDRMGLEDVVSLPGMVENPFPYMRTADVFALSSTHEGFGNVLVEAMAVGCPVVSTDCPSGPREILVDGEYGSLSPVGDAAALAENIKGVLDNPPEASHLQSRASNFEPETVAEEYLDVLGLNR